MRAVVISCMVLFSLTSCSRETPVFDMGGREVKYGDYPRSEIAALRTALEKLHFPVPEDTVVGILPRPLVAVPVAFMDWIRDPEKQGRIGGMAVDYWLNRKLVLRVATAYYSVDNKHYNMEEWAVILTRDERNQFTRSIY